MRNTCCNTYWDTTQNQDRVLSFIAIWSSSFRSLEHEKNVQWTFLNLMMFSFMLASLGKYWNVMVWAMQKNSRKVGSYYYIDIFILSIFHFFPTGKHQMLMHMVMSNPFIGLLAVFWSKSAIVNTSGCGLLFMPPFCCWLFCTECVSCVKSNTCSWMWCWKRW